MKKKTRIPILLYHRVTDKKDFKVRDESDFYTVGVDDFRRQMCYIRDSGYKTITLSKLLNKSDMPLGPIVITFDDGDVSNYEIAWPILRGLGFKATFFVVAGNVGEKGSLSWEQIEELSKEGIEFGSHGLTHRFLSSLDDEILANELENSKEILGERLGAEVDVISIPGGFYNRRVKDTVKRCGYKLACTSSCGVNDSKSDPFSLKRIAIRSDTGFNEFKKLIELPDVVFARERCVAKARGMLKKMIGVKNYTAAKERLIKAKR